MGLPTVETVAVDPVLREIAASSESLVIDARSLVISSPEGYEFAAGKLQEVKGRIKALEALRKSMTRPLDEAKSKIMDLFRAPAERLEQAEAGLKRALVVFSDAQERKRREEQARLEEAARKEREKLQRQAEAAAAKGREERAAVLEATAAAVVAPIAQTVAPKVAGVSFRSIWRAEVVDASLVPREYLMVDQAKLDKVAAALKGDTVIAGVKVREDRIASSRAAS
jgi:hypothetical protein